MSKFLLIIAIILGGIELAVFAGVSPFVRVELTDQPFIIYLAEPTGEDMLLCHEDENCMDVLPIWMLPKREDL